MKQFLLSLLVVLTACSTTHDAVSERRFQKRKHRPGWHVDLHRGERSRPPARDVEVEPMEVRSAKALTHVPGPHERGQPVHSGGQAVGTPLIETRPQDDIGPSEDHRSIVYPGRSWSALLTQGEDQEAKRPMNKNARAGFILALIGVFGALFVPFLWLALVAATVFGIIALFQIPKRHERGMFFAIFAAASLVLFFLLVVVLMNATGLGED